MVYVKCSPFIMVLFAVAYGSDVFTSEFETELRSFINASMNCRHVTGMTLAVVKGDDVWTSGFGAADYSSGKMVDEHTLFNIGSVTKSFTATLLGILLKEHGYDWNTKVRSILGSDYEFIDDYRTKEVTLKDMLSHRTGLATLNIGIMSGIDHSVSRAALCKKLKYLPEKRPIRDGFEYNNYVYIMLGHVAEVLGKDTWENLLVKRIFEPLGMNNTRMLSPQEILKADVARPYILKDGEFQNGTLEQYDIHPTEPMGGILSTASDMTKWIKFNLQLGKTENGTQLIEKKLMEQMQWPTTTFDSQDYHPDRFLTRPQYPVDEIQIGYGYGWLLSTYRGYKMLWHSGIIYSYRTLFYFFPDSDIGMYVSVNGPGFKRLAERHMISLFYYISDHLLGLEPWLNETTACTFPEPWANKSESESKEREVPITVEKPSEYEGSYSSPIFPSAEVRDNSTTLLLNFNRLHGVLHPSSEKDRFLWGITNPWEIAKAFTYDNNETFFTNITFLRNDHGAIESFKAVFDGTVNVTYTKAGMEPTSISGRVEVSFLFVACLLLGLRFTASY